MNPLPRITALAFSLTVTLAPAAGAFPNGVPDGYAGDPPALNTCVACHSTYPLDSGPGGAGFSQLSGDYTPGEQYEIQLLVGPGDVPSPDAWGFQMTVLDEANHSAGVILPPDSLAVLSDNPVPMPDYTSQNAEGVLAGSPYGLWTVHWIAPPAGTGPVHFYLAGLAADGDGSADGDYVYSAELTVTEGGGGVNGPQPFLPETYHDFGFTPLDTERPWTTTLYNIGGGELEIDAWQWANGPWFSVLEPAPPLALVSGESVTLTVAFAPEVTGSWADTLALATAGGGLFDSLLVVEGEGTHPLPPTPFDLLSPADGETVGGDSLAFRWSASTNPDSTDPAVEYVLEIDSESDFMDAVTWEAGADTLFTLPPGEFEDGGIYFWRVFAQDTNTGGVYSNQAWAFFTDFTGVGEGEAGGRTPVSPFILSAYPNPFNGIVSFRLELSVENEVTVEVHDIRGRHVATVHSGPLPAGTHRIAWDPGALASGIYLLRVRAPGTEPLVRKLILVR